MKIAFISSSSPFADGGAAVSTRLLSNGLREYGIEVDVYSLTGSEHELHQEANNVFKIPSGEAYRIDKRIGRQLSVLRHLPRLSNYDVIHVYGTDPLPGLILRSKVRRSPTPLLVTVNTLSWVCTNWVRYLEQSCPKFDSKKVVEYAIAKEYPPHLIPPKIGLEITGRTLAKYADHYTVQTTGMKHVLQQAGFDQSKVEVIPNLYDERFILDSNSPNQQMIFLGRLIERKGILEIIDVYKELDDNIHNEWNFSIYGIGHLEEKLKKQTQDTDSISISHRPYSELPSVYQNSSLLIHGSKYPEPFSRTWLEAMGSKTAILAARNPSSESVLGEFAELYNPFNTDELHDKLYEILSNPQRLEQMKMQGRKEISKYAPSSVIPKYIEIYEYLKAGVSIGAQ